MPINILVVGGAGYIGSHMVLHLRRAGFNPIVLDNLSSGYADAIFDAEFIHGDVMDTVLLEDIFKRFSISAVMHFAAYIEVNESVRNPAKYYQNNIVGTICLLNAMVRNGIHHFVFSSSAAVYGEPQYTPMDENHPLKPLNPCGHSKQMIEQILKDYARAYDFHYISLRYFNAAGAEPSGLLKERHAPETHLIPLILQAAENNTAVAIYGKDYPTPDGTCIRDFVHVVDLCAAHLLALEALLADKPSATYNLGTGEGYSVSQVIDITKEVTKREIAVNIKPRRAGDPPILVANPMKAKMELKWQPQFELRSMIEHVWMSEGRY